MTFPLRLLLLLAICFLTTPQLRAQKDSDAQKTPTPQFHTDGAPAKKILDDKVKIVQSGTSSLTPKELADGWEADAGQKPLNHIRNNNESNGLLSTTMFLSTRTDPPQEVRMHAGREPNEKITNKVEISSPLPKPEIENE